MSCIEFSLLFLDACSRYLLSLFCVPGQALGKEWWEGHIVLVTWGHCNKMSQIGVLRQCFLSHSSGGWEVPDQGASTFSDGTLVRAYLAKPEGSGRSFYKDTYPVHEPHSHSLITSWNPHTGDFNIKIWGAYSVHCNYEIWCYLWIDSSRIEVDWRTPWWCHRTACWCGEALCTYIGIDTGIHKTPQEGKKPS